MCHWFKTVLFITVATRKCIRTFVVLQAFTALLTNIRLCWKDFQRTKHSILLSVTKKKVLIILTICQFYKLFYSSLTVDELTRMFVPCKPFQPYLQRLGYDVKICQKTKCSSLFCNSVIDKEKSFLKSITVRIFSRIFRSGLSASCRRISGSNVIKLFFDRQ